MIDEILFMQIRILSQYSLKYNIDKKKCNEIFENYGIYDYIRKSYGGLHCSGDNYVINCIDEILNKEGVLNAFK